MSQQSNLKLVATKYVVAMKNETLGELIRKLRVEQGWSQSELARRIGGGVKPQNIQQLEGGTVNQPRYLKDLARVFHKSVDELFEGSGATPARKGGVPDYAVHLARRISSVTPEQIRAINLIIDSGPEKSKAILELLGDKEKGHHQPSQPPAPNPDRRQEERRQNNIHEVDFERRSGLDPREDKGARFRLGKDRKNKEEIDRRRGEDKDGADE